MLLCLYDRAAESRVQQPSLCFAMQKGCVGKNDFFFYSDGVSVYVQRDRYFTPISQKLTCTGNQSLIFFYFLLSFE